MNVISTATYDQGLNEISTARYDQGLNVISTARYDQGLNKIPKLKNETTFFCVQNRITVFKKKNFHENIKSKHTRYDLGLIKYQN